MADLKLDLINKINNEKYYEELELVRLAADSSINYKEKIDNITNRFANLAILNAQLVLVEQYFKPVGAPTGAPTGAPVGQVHQGQTHGE